MMLAVVIIAYNKTVALCFASFAVVRLRSLKPIERRYQGSNLRIFREL